MHRRRPRDIARRDGRARKTLRARKTHSETTAENDIVPKREIHQSLAIGDFCCFHAIAGDLYGEPLIGERLVGGRFRPFDLSRGNDESVLGFDLSWERNPDGDGWLYLYDSGTGERLRSYSEVAASRRAIKAQVDTAQERAVAIEEEARQLREKLPRLRGE